ncbi:MAG: nuclease [Synechococcus sp.]
MIRVLVLLLVLFCAGLSVDAAEVLQVRSSQLLQVGDRNRTYTVQLTCLDVAASDEDRAVSWLREQLPRRRRVNLRPAGSIEGQLLARVTPIGSDQDLSAGLIAAGLASDRCSSELS